MYSIEAVVGTNDGKGETAAVAEGVKVGVGGVQPEAQIYEPTHSEGLLPANVFD